MNLKEGDELPREEISAEAKELAEALWNEARTDRIFSIIELALRDVKEKLYFDLLFSDGLKEPLKNEEPNSTR